MKNSVACSEWQDKKEHKLAATGVSNVGYDLVNMALLSPVAVGYGVLFFLKIFIT